jgi:hypothetical protein
LPEETAAEQIIALIDGLPRRMAVSLDRMKVASRLSAWLPRSTAPNLSGVRPVTAAAGQSPAAVVFNRRFFYLYLYLYLCLMLLMNWLTAGFHATTSAVAESDTRTGATTTAPDADSPSKDPGKLIVDGQKRDD